MKFKSKWSIAALILLLLLASYAAFKLGEYVTSKNPERAPASIEDFSGLDEDEFRKRGINHMGRLTRLRTYANYSAIQVGHFFGPTRSTSVCETYPSVVIELRAENVAVSGEAVKLTVRAPCEMDRDRSYLKPIPIPVPEFLSTRPKEGAFHSNLHPEVQYFFYNLVLDEWPQSWLVHSIQLTGPTKSLRINQEMLRELKKGPLIMRWSQL